MESVSDKLSIRAIVDEVLMRERNSFKVKLV